MYTSKSPTPSILLLPVGIHFRIYGLGSSIGLTEFWATKIQVVTGGLLPLGQITLPMLVIYTSLLTITYLKAIIANPMVLLSVDFS